MVFDGNNYIHKAHSTFYALDRLGQKAGELEEDEIKNIILPFTATAGMNIDDFTDAYINAATEAEKAGQQEEFEKQCKAAKAKADDMLENKTKQNMGITDVDIAKLERMRNEEIENIKRVENEIKNMKQQHENKPEELVEAYCSQVNLIMAQFSDSSKKGEAQELLSKINKLLSELPECELKNKLQKSHDSLLKFPNINDDGTKNE